MYGKEIVYYFLLKAANPKARSTKRTANISSGDIANHLFPFCKLYHMIELKIWATIIVIKITIF